LASWAPWAPGPGRGPALRGEADPAEPRPAGEGDGEGEEDLQGSAREQAREHFRAGAHVLAEAINERLRNSPAAMNTIRTSIRESADTLGLTSSGRHAEKSRLPVVGAVPRGVRLLLALVFWALVGRWCAGRSHS